MTHASFAPLAAIPSPTVSVWEIPLPMIGSFPLRAYSLCIVLGIVAACAVTEHRLRQRGAPRWAVLDIAVWAVPFGIVGARIYHVVTSPENYFGPGGDPVRAFYIWEGGLGIWGAVAGGALGAWLAARQIGLPLSVVADALAPGMPLAQAIGRFGNWFNNELYGGPTSLPWGLEVYNMIDGRAEQDPAGNPVLAEPGLVHPTFAYEALWNIGVALLVFLVDRRLKLGRGRAFALYVMGYTAGRFWIELMRTDPANEIIGVRLNVWTSALVFLAATAYFLRVRGPREYLVPLPAAPVATGPAAPAGTESTGGDVSQVNLTPARAAAAAPTTYRVVTAAEYDVYRETGELPGGSDGEATSLLDDFADDEPDDIEDGDDAVDAGADDENDDPDDSGADDAEDSGADDENDDAVDDDVQAKATARPVDDPKTR